MSEDKDKKQKLPSFFQMAKNFAVELKKYVAEGAPNVTLINYHKRLAACEGCDDLIKDRMRCGLCGCLIEHKAKWKTADCPAKPSKWPIEVKTFKDINKKNLNFVGKDGKQFKRNLDTKTSNSVPDADKQSKGDS